MSRVWKYSTAMEPERGGAAAAAAARPHGGGVPSGHWAPGDPATKVLLSQVFGILAGVGSACVYGTIEAGAIWGRRHGLRLHDAFKFVFFGGRQSFWKQPQIAALLLPPPGRVNGARPTEPRSPDEYARAIRDLVGQLPSGTQATVSEAAEAARQLLGAVAALDAELAKLAQDADPQELEAVEAKLRALGSETPDEGDVRGQKRALLGSQRDLLRELNQRLVEAGARRARLLDLLRTMWLQLATLRAETARDSLAVTEISGRVTALCAEIHAQVQAAETVRVELR